MIADTVPARTARIPSPNRAPRTLIAAASMLVLGAACLAPPSSTAPASPPARPASAASSTPLPATGVALEFYDAAGDERRLDLSVLGRACATREVEVDDPYHDARMRYAALSLRCILDQGFAPTGGAEGLRGRGLLLRALDGYTRPVSGDELLEAGGFVAFGEPKRLLEHAKDGRVSPFSPLDRRAIDPAPFYLVWTGQAQSDPHTHPWPYQLARIEVAPFEEAFPHTVPAGLSSGDPGWSGYAVFQRACASCHSINGEGGKVGPELNVPRSIVEYRPIPQIRAYIRNPQATRYTSMPPHPDLEEAELDALIAYFRAMSERKHDPQARGAS